MNKDKLKDGILDVLWMSIVSAVVTVLVTRYQDKIGTGVLEALSKVKSKTQDTGE